MLEREGLQMDIRDFRAANDQSNDSIQLAGFLLEQLGASPDMPLRPADEVKLEAMESFRFGSNDSRVGWRAGNGPPVLIVHGYSGRAAQMLPIADMVVSNGYEAILFDAGGHGASRPEKIGFFTFINDVRDIAEYLNIPFHMMIGHSAGALAMMRSRELYDVWADKYAVIAAPFYPYVPLNSLRAAGATDPSIDHVKSALSDQFRTDWASLMAGRAFSPEADKSMLAIYDLDDPKVQHTDAECILSVWHGTQIVKTIGQGHNKILKSPETLSAISHFLQNGS